MDKKQRLFEQYQQFIELEENFISRKVTDHALNMRLPKKMNELIEMEILDLKQTIGVNVSKNDFIVMMLMTVLNYEQASDNPKHIDFADEDISLTNFLYANKTDLVERKKRLWFERQLDALTQPHTRIKTRVQRAKGIDTFMQE